MNIRLYFALGISLFGLVLAGLSLWNGQPLIALSLALAGSTVALVFFWVSAKPSPTLCFVLPQLLSEQSAYWGVPI